MDKASAQSNANRETFITVATWNVNKRTAIGEYLKLLKQYRVDCAGVQEGERWDDELARLWGFEVIASNKKKAKILLNYATMATFKKALRGNATVIAVFGDIIFVNSFHLRSRPNV